MKLILPVFFLNEVTRPLKEAGQDYDVFTNDVRRTVIYGLEDIIMLEPGKSKNGKAYCSINFINEDTFASPLPLRMVEKYMDAALRGEEADAWTEYKKIADGQGI